jgi:hypothetical protein
VGFVFESTHCDKGDQLMDFSSMGEKKLGEDLEWWRKFDYG